MSELFTSPNTIVFVASIVAFIALLVIFHSLFSKSISRSNSVLVSVLLALLLCVVGHIKDAELRGNVFTVIAVMIFIGVLWFTQRIPQAKSIILGLVVEAEKTFGSSTGTMKYAYVSGLVYPRLPSVVRFFITQETLDAWIEEAVDDLKKYLALTDVDMRTITSVPEAETPVISDTSDTPIE